MSMIYEYFLDNVCGFAIYVTEIMSIALLSGMEMQNDIRISDFILNIRDNEKYLFIIIVYVTFNNEFLRNK
jgi:hypothetical protein